MARKGGFLKGTLLGAVAAGIGALLLAPKSGKETREDIHQSFNDVKDRLNKGLDDIKEASVRVKEDSVAETRALIRRAEKLRQDLNATALKLSSVSDDTKHEVTEQASALITEGQAMVEELETLGRELSTSAKQTIGQAAQSLKKDAQKTTRQAEKVVSQSAAKAKKTTSQTKRSLSRGVKKATKTTQTGVKKAATNARTKK